MKKLCIIFATILLSACSTTTELKSEAAPQTFKSSKPSKDVWACIVNGFEGIYKTAGVTSKPTETGYTVYVSIGVALGKDTALTVDVNNTGAGSTSLLYSKLLWGNDKPINVVTNCQ